MVQVLSLIHIFDCFDGVSLANVLRATGVNDAGEIAEHEEYLAQARQLGAGIR